MCHVVRDGRGSKKVGKREKRGVLKKTLGKLNPKYKCYQVDINIAADTKIVCVSNVIDYYIPYHDTYYRNTVTVLFDN